MDNQSKFCKTFKLEGFFFAALFQIQTILFKNVDISEYMYPVLLMLWLMQVTRPGKVRGAREI